jgi:elongation factor 3
MVQPFLGELIPALSDTIDTIADPEARDVATKTHEALLAMQSAGDALSKEKSFRKPSAIAGFITKTLGPVPSSKALLVSYAAGIAAALIRTSTTEPSEYEDELKPYLAILGHPNGWKVVRDNAMGVISEGTDAGTMDDGEEGEVLCDCDFTLAYGTKILLHNARLRLKKGMKYGLLGQNDCGKVNIHHIYHTVTHTHTHTHTPMHHTPSSSFMSVGWPCA